MLSLTRSHEVRASQVALVVKNPPTNSEDIRDLGSIPGSGRSLRGGHGNPLQYSFLENTMDRGSWQANSQWGHKESHTTEQLTLSLSYICTHVCVCVCVCACMHVCSAASIMSDSLHHYGLQLAKLLCTWDSPGKNIRVGCHVLLQGIFPPQ